MGGLGGMWVLYWFVQFILSGVREIPLAAGADVNTSDMILGGMTYWPRALRCGAALEVAWSASLARYCDKAIRLSRLANAFCDGKTLSA